jgi:hypothetical protein
MIPEQRMSSQNIPAPFLAPRDIDYLPEENYELGGVALNDSSQGLRVKVWRGRLVDNQIILDADDVSPIVVVSGSGITEFQFTFDQNMRPFVCYVEDGSAKFYWYDSNIASFATTVMASGVTNPRCALDDKRSMQSSLSDIILAYVREGSLYFRAQRDRYLAEYQLIDGGVDELVQMGMSRGNRLQFRIMPL